MVDIVSNISYNDKKQFNVVFVRQDNLDSQPIQTVVIPNIPQALQIRYTPKFSTQQLLGRLTPLYQYSGASGVSYTFTLDLHEDIHVEKGKTLNDLINDIKSLSAPRLSEGGLVGDYPDVFFTLGDISAFVKVETQITWKKPMRQGKYIMATVQFTLDVVEEVPEIRTRRYFETMGVIPEGLEDLYYADEMSFLFTTEERQKYEQHILSNYGYLLGYAINKYDIQGTQTATKAWDVAQQQLVEVFGIYRETAALKTTIDKNETLKAILDKKGLMQMPTTYTDYNKLQKDLLRLRNTTHKTIADYYRTDVSETMTRAEMQQVIKYVNNIIDTLLDIASGVLGYGAAQ